MGDPLGSPVIANAGGNVKKRRNDVILPAAILFIAALLWLGLFLTRSQGALVRVTVDGKLIGEYPLDKQQEIRIGDENAYNILSIADGKAEIIEASCPDKLCVHQGKVQYDGQSIICLPNKLVAQVAGGEKSEIDVVAK